MKLFVIRHTSVTVEQGLCYGQTEVPLAYSFDAEVAKIQKKLPAKFDACYTSPAKRCLTLAKTLMQTSSDSHQPADNSNTISPIIEKRLLELNFGTWEGKLWDDICMAKSETLSANKNQSEQTHLNNDYQKWSQDFVKTAPPNGETLQAMYQRIVDFIETLRIQTRRQDTPRQKHLSEPNKENLLIVTHAGVIRCIWAYVLGLPLKNIFRLPVGYGEVLIINIGHEPSYDRILQKC